MISLKTNRELTINELKELLNLMDNQESSDKYLSTELHINGDNATIDVCIDEYGNIEVI